VGPAPEQQWLIAAICRTPERKGRSISSQRKLGSLEPPSTNLLRSSDLRTAAKPWPLAPQSLVKAWRASRIEGAIRRVRRERVPQGPAQVEERNNPAPAAAASTARRHGGDSQRSMRAVLRPSRKGLSRGARARQYFRLRWRLPGAWRSRRRSCQSGDDSTRLDRVIPARQTTLEVMLEAEYGIRILKPVEEAAPLQRHSLSSRIAPHRGGSAQLLQAFESIQLRASFRAGRPPTGRRLSEGAR